MQDAVIGLTRGIFQSRIYLVGLLACCFKTYLTWAIMPPPAPKERRAAVTEASNMWVVES